MRAAVDDCNFLLIELLLSRGELHEFLPSCPNRVVKVGNSYCES